MTLFCEGGYRTVGGSFPLVVKIAKVLEANLIAEKVENAKDLLEVSRHMV